MYLRRNAEQYQRTPTNGETLAIPTTHADHKHIRRLHAVQTRRAMTKQRNCLRSRAAGQTRLRQQRMTYRASPSSLKRSTRDTRYSLRFQKSGRRLNSVLLKMSKWSFWDKTLITASGRLMDSRSQSSAE